MYSPPLSPKSIKLLLDTRVGNLFLVDDERKVWNIRRRTSQAVFGDIKGTDNLFVADGRGGKIQSSSFAYAGWGANYKKKNWEKPVEEVKISLEKLVPENHILRKIDKAIDFNFIWTRK